MFWQKEGEPVPLFSLWL